MSGMVDVILVLASASDIFLTVFLAIVLSWKRRLNITKCEVRAREQINLLINWRFITYIYE